MLSERQVLAHDRKADQADIRVVVHASILAFF